MMDQIDDLIIVGMDLNPFMCELAEQAEIIVARLRRIEKAAKLHPRALKLLLEGKNFIVIAEHEPYFLRAYEMIREQELKQGTWAAEDEIIFMTYHKAKAE
jgi:hypothetical protein